MPTKSEKPTFHRYTMAALKAWADKYRNAAETVLLAQAFAECERQRVDAYIEPLFRSYGFIDADKGEPIPESKRLYRASEDAATEARVKDFYAACDRAHREHGFTGPEGHCPALIAESTLITAQNILLEAAAELGLTPPFWSLDLRARALDLLLKICLGDGKGRTADQILRGGR